MTLRLLHTSDWHLGATFRQVSRAPEHRAFLDWLVQQVAEAEVRPDVLVIAGDVFDHAHPSAEAQALYYGFLRDLVRTGIDRVVVVGGNHDSGARLDAPREVLESLSVSVVGAYDGMDSDLNRFIVPIRREGTVVGVVLAVPYVHEYRLGVRSAGERPEVIRRDLSDRLKALYSRITDEAAARFPGVPLVATGHLTCLGRHPDPAAEGVDDLGSTGGPDVYPKPIHQVGTIEGIGEEVFDPRLAYVALGHIHRPCLVGSGRLAYCGSPIQLTVEEGRPARRILRVTVDEALTVEEVYVPTHRQILSRRMAAEQLDEELRELADALARGEEPLPPLLELVLEVDDHDPALDRRVRNVLDALPDERRPTVLGIREERRRVERTSDPDAREELPSLRDLSPEQVFVRCCEAGGEDPEALLGAFRELIGSLEVL